ncbi:unnamed protein product [Scytosiphon promiscuus]
MARASTGSERRPQTPAKLRTAEADAVTKPCEVKSSTVRSAFTAISSRFPSEISLQDLQAFVAAHGLGISRATLREMVGRASAKRRDWRARGRALPRRVMRDKLWVEDVMWALRVRKTRQEFDKWEVNEHRKEWVSILEAATPENPTVFATSPDHRVAPPFSYTELLHDSAPVFSSPSLAAGWTLAAAQGGSNTSVSTSCRGSNSGRYGSRSTRFQVGGCGSKDDGRDRRGEGLTRHTARRPATTGRMWKPLESRLPTSLLLVSRPVSAKAAAGEVVGDLVGSTEGETSTFADGTPWEGDGGVGDSTVSCFPSGAGVGNSGGENRDDLRHCGGGGTEAGHSEGNGGLRRPIVTAQERALFGRKPSPAMVARSTCYAPRRRPPCSADGCRLRPNDGDDGDIAGPFEMEIDINGSSFIPIAFPDHLSSTATTQQHGLRDGRGTTRAGGSVASALTFDDNADLSHVRSTAAAEDVQTAPAEATREAGQAAEVTEEATGIGTASSSGTLRATIEDRDNAPGSHNLDEVVNGGSGGGIASHPASGGDTEEAGGGEGAAAWWRDALAPTSRRPVTRRSLVCSRAAGGGTRSTGCIRGSRKEVGVRVSEPREHGECRWSVHGTVYGAEASGGDRRRSATAAPICGFPTESKHRGLEDFLNRRSSIAESEGLAAARVEGWEQAFARARSGAPFRQFVGRGTIRENYDESLIDKVGSTLTLDLRGHGINLVAPETTTMTATAAIGTAKMGRATAVAAVVAEKRARTRTMARAWSSSRVEGGRESGVATGNSEPPPFRAKRGPTVQESRAAVVTHQVGMWGKCAQAQYGRFEEKPYVHSFR